MRITAWALVLLNCASMAIAGTISGQVTVLGENEQTDVVVYLEGDLEGQYQPPMKNPEILQRDQVFSPATLAVLKGTTVEFPNDDDVFHNAFSFSPSNPFDFGPYGPGKDQRVQMKTVGLVEVFCDVHEHMYSYILVLDHVYFAMTNKNRYSIPNIPEGQYTVKAFLSPDVVVSKKVALKQGETINLDFSLNAGGVH